MGMVIKPFCPSSKTLAIIGGTTPPDGERVIVFPGTYDAGVYRVVNSSDVEVFFAVGNSPEDAKAKATESAGEGFGSLILLPRSVEVFQFKQNAYFSARVASGSAVIYVTLGEGI